MTAATNSRNHRLMIMNSETPPVQDDGTARIEQFKLAKLFHKTMRHILSSEQYAVFCALEDRASVERGGWCWPSYNTIAEDCNISRRGAIYAIKQLRELGLLEINERYSDRWSSNDYKPATASPEVIAGLKAKCMRDMCKVCTSEPFAPPSAENSLAVVNEMHPNCTNDLTEPKELNKTTPNGVAGKPRTPAKVKNLFPHPKPTSKKQSKPKEEKPPDLTLEHPAVIAWREMALKVNHKAWPNLTQRQDICDTINAGDDVQMRRWHNTLNHWAKHDYQFRNIPAMLEVFLHGVNSNNHSRRERRT